MIFGGAARDKFLHDIHSTKFYEHVHNLSRDELDLMGKTANELYQDPTYLPDLHGRFVCPADIDAYIHASEHEKLMEALGDKVPVIKKVFERDAKRYFPEMKIDYGAVTHYRYHLRMMQINEVRGWLHTLDKIIPIELRQEHRNYVYNVRNGIMGVLNEGIRLIKLDLMVYTKAYDSTMPDPPFGDVDFRCNSLIWDNSGFRLSKAIPLRDPVARFKTLEQVMSDIEEQRADVVSLKWYRVQKMMRRGWKVCGLFRNIQQIRDITYEGHCIICHGSLTEQDDIEATIIPHMKLKCCDGRYHPSCLLQAITVGDHSMQMRGCCSHCSQPLIGITKDGDNLNGFIENHLHLELNVT